MPAEDSKLARNIRSLRKARRLSLSNLARLTGIAASNLSSIELGKTSPTVNTLRRIADAFQVRLSSLLEEELTPLVFFWRESEGLPEAPITHDVTTYKVSSRDSAFHLTGRLIRLNTLSARLHLTGEMTERLIYCLQGKLHGIVGDQKYLLSRGDTLHVRGTLNLSNQGSGEAVILVVERRTVETS